MFLRAATALLNDSPTNWPSAARPCHVIRERPYMMSASEGGHGKAEVVREVA